MHNKMYVSSKHMKMLLMIMDMVINMLALIILLALMMASHSPDTIEDKGAFGN